MTGTIGLNLYEDCEMHQNIIFPEKSPNICTAPFPDQLWWDEYDGGRVGYTRWETSQYFIFTVY